MVKTESFIGNERNLPINIIYNKRSDFSGINLLLKQQDRRFLKKKEKV
jgi:hypothetical protein